MKFGILTWHAQLNYGGVLQAYALRVAIQALGHDAVVVDKWLEPSNRPLYPPLREDGSFLHWKLFLRCLLCEGMFARLVRCLRTVTFLRRCVKLSECHFCDWQEVQWKDLGVDALVVGSDQVWNANSSYFRSYLLESAPVGTKAIAYAASFGMPCIPKRLQQAYVNGMARFRRISVREQEGVALVASCGKEAVRVVDPTLLLSRRKWLSLVKPRHSRKRCLVCYVLAEDAERVMRELEPWVIRMNCQVRLVVDTYLRPMPKSVKDIGHQFVRRLGWFGARIKICAAAGPLQFLDLLANASWVLTDSFHAVMFSVVYGKNVRVLRPHSGLRRQMFSRIEELQARWVGQGELCCDSVADALSGWQYGATIVFDERRIEQDRAESLAWLKESLSEFAEEGSRV